MEAVDDRWDRRWVEEALLGLSTAWQSPGRPVVGSVPRAAYRQCGRITKASSRTFYLASALLPREKRRAMRTLYAFCRTTDDIVDHPSASARQELMRWRHLALEGQPTEKEPVALAWAQVRAQYGIPTSYAERLISGAEQDLSKIRYRSFDDLADYCYAVASSVGLMAMHVTGFVGPAAVPYAVRLGIALQLTNILRDVAEDWTKGRLYLPLDELASFGLEEEDIAAGRVDDQWRAFMQFQIARCRRLYTQARPGISLLHRDGQLAVAAAADLYAAILEDIEAHNYDVFSQRARLSTWMKLRRLPGIYCRVRRQTKSSGSACGVVDQGASSR